MTFYKYTYNIDQNIELAFNYFLRKQYLTRFFTEEDGKNVIKSTYNDNPLMSEDEFIALVNEDEEAVISINFEVLKIQQNSSIQMKMTVDYLEDKSEEFLDLDEEEEMDDLMSKFFGKGILYTINFLPQKNGRLKIVEFSEIKDAAFSHKLFFLFYGLYTRISKNRTHKEVKKELEMLV